MESMASTSVRATGRGSFHLVVDPSAKREERASTLDLCLERRYLGLPSNPSHDSFL